MHTDLDYVRMLSPKLKTRLKLYAYFSEDERGRAGCSPALCLSLNVAPFLHTNLTDRFRGTKRGPPFSKACKMTRDC